MWNDILSAAKAMSILEVLGVLTAVAYVILAAKRSIFCWLFAIISSVSFGILLFQSKLYSESLLQVFYLVMAIYGWLNWRQNLKSNSDVQITEWPLKYHLVNIILSAVASLVLGFLFSQTDASYPYLDACTTVFALSATFMVVRRILSNWLYWIAIDALGVYLFFSKELYLTAVLFIAYIIISVIGYIKWRNSMFMSLNG